MPALEDMRALTQEIAQAHRNRTEGVGELRANVTSGLAAFESEQRMMSKDQRANLARAEAANKAAVAGLLSGFHGGRKNMSRQLHNELNRDNRERSAGVGSTLANLSRSKHAAAVSLRNDLSQGSSARRAAVESTLAGLSKGRQVLTRGLEADLSRDNSKRKSAVAAMLGDFDATQRTMCQTFRTWLAQSHASRKASVTAMLRDWRDEQAQTRSERQAVRNEWHKLAGAMHSTGGIAAGESVERGTALPDAPPVLSPTTTQPVAEDNPELAVLRNRVFVYLADRPDGTRLVEIEEEMGVSRFQMSRVLRSLMDDNMVEKRDMLYFAI